MNNVVTSLTVYNNELIAGGGFIKAGGVDVNNIARWDGNSWKPLGGGMSGTNISVSALTIYNGELIAGGSFSVNSAYLARWGLPEVYMGDLNHDCAVDWFDAALFAKRWLNEDCMYNGWCYEADLNYDFIVDFEDFAKLADNWLAGL
jgi:hypothetical protein